MERFMDLIPLWYWLAVFFVFGACVGSFYNVIVYRMPRGISLVNPPSHCPLCKKRIPIYLNLPVVGWLILRGKTACCHKPLNIIYPIGEALCGLLGALALFAAVALNYGQVVPELFMAPVVQPAVWADALALFWLLLAIYPVCAVDFKYKLIPDSMSVGGIVVGLLLSLIPGGITPLQSLAGAVVAGGSLYLLGYAVGKLLKKEAMGFGDVKLLAGYGALMGLQSAALVLVIAAVLGLLVMLPYVKIQQKVAEKSVVDDSEDAPGQIPFGPFLAIAAPIVYLWGDFLIALYIMLVLGE